MSSPVDLEVENDRLCNENVRLCEEVKVARREQEELAYKLSLTNHGTRIFSDKIVSLEQTVSALSSTLSFFPAQDKVVFTVNPRDLETDGEKRKSI